MKSEDVQRDSSSPGHAPHDPGATVQGAVRHFPALRYPLLTSAAALLICLLWLPFASADLRALLILFCLIILGYTGFRMARARGSRTLRQFGEGPVRVRRVRQQHLLSSRSWLEFGGARTRWVPVYFDPLLVMLAESDGDTATKAEICSGALHIGTVRLYPAGRVRDSEPRGRLVDNPSRPDPDGPDHAARAARWWRRLVLDGQLAVAAPFVALLWTYIAGGGLLGFAGTAVAAFGLLIWLSAIQGSDPS